MPSNNMFEASDDDFEAINFNSQDSSGAPMDVDDDLAGASDIHLSSDDEFFNTDKPFYFNSEDEEEEEYHEDADENFNFLDAVREAANFKPKSKAAYLRSKMRTSGKNDPEIFKLLSDGNKAYVAKDREKALEIYKEVVRKDPKNFPAYKTLGEINREMGRLNECCNYWFLAASLNPSDDEFWFTVGQLSEELGHIDQAIECYTRAISANNNDMRTVLARAKLYKEQERWGRALEGFQRVLSVYPTDTTILKELASVYVDQKRCNDAIKLYNNLLDKNMDTSLTEQERQRIPKFTWAELNIFLELCITEGAFRQGIRVAKKASRWLQNREMETWWNDIDDDSEFDARRFACLDKRSYSEQIAAKDKAYEVPIDIRFKLGTLRLGLGDKDEAMRHFEFLKTEDNVLDLYWETGTLLESNGYYEEALSFLSLYQQYETSMDFETESQLIPLLGKCYQEIGQYGEAAKNFEKVLNWKPNDDENKLALAEVYYHLGKIGESKLLLQQVSKNGKFKSINRNWGAETIEDISINSTANIIDTYNTPIIQSNLRAGTKKMKLSDEEKVKIETNAKKNVLEKFHRMQKLEEAMFAGDSIAITAWIQLASQLVEMFINVRSFFPRDKNRIFKGIVFYRRKKSMGIDERLDRILDLHSGINSDEAQTRSVLTSKTDYRGLDYNTWFGIFVQYALSLANFEKNMEYAIQIIEVAADASVFVQDKNKEMILKLVRLMFGINQKDVNVTVMTYVRFFLSSNQFSPFIYKFFMCCFASGIESWETFSNYNHQKFFLRQLKAYDSILSSQKHITGMATISANPSKVVSKREHAELLYVYANLLGGSRSYVSSIVYLNRAYKQYDKDPMICLVLGLAHVHRSMQRLSSNRHIQLLQGISYIMEYRNIRMNSKSSTEYEKQEVEYNLGRLFHMLGLTTLAVKQYHKVFDITVSDKMYDISIDAAYNLTLIYNINGNSKLAREITEKYLVV